MRTVAHDVTRRRRPLARLLAVHTVMHRVLAVLLARDLIRRVEAIECPVAELVVDGVLERLE